MLTSDVVVGRYAPDFELPGVDGSVHHLRDYLAQFQVVGVVFLANNCPLALQWVGHLTQLQAKFANQGVQLVAINANDGGRSPADRFEAMAAFAAYHQLNFPYLRDETQDVAEAFDAVCTPHAFLLNQEGVICYSGSIGLGHEVFLSPTAAPQHGMQGAIATLLRGRMPSPALTDPVGSPIQWRSPHPYHFRFTE